MPACAQCRQRKVRCNGGTNSCEACIRLGFVCSLNDSPSPISPLVERSTAVPRKRGGRACDQCRAHKVRCIRKDTADCLRCQQHGQPCTYSLFVRQFRVQQHRQRRVDAISSESSQATFGDFRGGISPATKDTPCSPNENPGLMDNVLGCNTVVARQHIDAFFEFVHPVPMYNFLHRAEVLRQYSLGSLPPVILLAICGTASRFLSSKNNTDRAKSWIGAAESKVLRCLGEAKLHYAEALMILGYNRRCNHQSGKTFFFVSLAARMVYHLRLHIENRDLPFLEQERRRRLVWCIFTVDRFCAGGVQEYLVLPTASLHIQLPCHERYFETDTAVKTSFLNDQETLSSELSLSAILLRLFDVRNRILQYAKVHLESSISPELSLTQFKKFEEELQNIHESVPPELHFSAHAFELRAFSPERTSFVIFHIYLHHCHCELYRLLNPGYREALHESVIDSTSPELVAYAQLQCLQHAIAIGEIVATTYRLIGNGLYVSDASIFVILYQASCAILYACHRDSPAFAMSPNTAQRYFTVFIETLARLLEYFPKFSIYVEDIRNMLRSIIEPNAPLPRQEAAVEVDFRARPVPGGERSDSDESVLLSSAKQDGACAPASPPGIDLTKNMPADKLTDSSPTNDQSVGPPVLNEDFFWPYLGTTEYDTGLISDPSQGLLWDWADALGQNIAR